MFLKPGALQDTGPGHSGVWGPGRSGKPIPPTSAKVCVLPSSRPHALPHLRIEHRLLVPVLASVPDRQGVVAPLQVKVLEGQLDHLGRGTELGSRQGLPETSGEQTFPCFVPMPSPRDTILQDPQSTEAFPCHLFECELFFSRPHSLWGPLMFSKDVHSTSAQFRGLLWQHQAHLADSEMISLFLHALMHRNPRGRGGNFSGHMWNLSLLAPRDLQMSFSQLLLCLLFFIFFVCLFVESMNVPRRRF